jgi:hypothetical protein
MCSGELHEELACKGQALDLAETSGQIWISTRSRYLAIYWLAVENPDEDGAGVVVVTDPRSGVQNSSGESRLVFTASAGELVVVPGWLGISISPVPHGSLQRGWKMELN